MQFLPSLVGFKDCSVPPYLRLGRFCLLRSVCFIFKTILLIKDVGFTIFSCRYNLPTSLSFKAQENFSLKNSYVRETSWRLSQSSEFPQVSDVSFAQIRLAAYRPQRCLRVVTLNGILEHLKGDVESESEPTTALRENPAADVTKVPVT